LCTVQVAGTRELVGPGGVEVKPPWQVIAGHDPSPAPSGNYYAIFKRWRTADCWQNPAPGRLGGTVGGFYQDLGAEPASPADAAAWRAAGSPSHWQSWQDSHVSDSARPGPDSPTPAKLSADAGEEPWGRDASLPADPAKLKATLLAHIPGPDDAGTKYILRSEKVTYQWYHHDQYVNYLYGIMNLQVRAAVRASALELLADVPGITMRPGVTLPGGMTGTSVWEAPDGPGSFEVIDPATARLIGGETIVTRPTPGAPVGAVIDYWMVVSERWTNHLLKG
jgi:hypothetical protein